MDERTKFWIDQFTRYNQELNIATSSNYADQALAEWDKRFTRDGKKKS
jgi:hypothetical protein